MWSWGWRKKLKQKGIRFNSFSPSIHWLMRLFLVAASFSSLWGEPKDSQKLRFPSASLTFTITHFPTNEITPTIEDKRKCPSPLHFFSYLLSHYFHWETFLLFPLAACSHPETGRPGFSSWTRNTSRAVLAPGAHEEKFQNMPLTRHICMQARTEAFRKSGFGFQAPSFQWGVTCQQCDPSLSQCPLLCRDLVICLSCLMTPTIPGNNGFEEALKREERANPMHRSKHKTTAQTGRDR